MDDQSREIKGKEGFATLKALVEECESDGWQFTFVGAGLDTIAAQAGAMGIHPAMVIQVTGDADGTSRGFADISNGYTDYRRRGGSSSGGGQVH